MSDAERLRRPGAERTGPIRNWADLVRREAAPGPACAAPASAGPTTPSAESAEGAPLGVSLGYRVIEEYLRQGRQEAELHGLRNAAGSGAASFEALSGRLLRDGLDWLESLARLWRWLDPLAGAAPAAASGAAAAAAVAFRLRVACDAPAELRIELRPGAAGRSLGVQILRAPDPRVAAIDGVELAMDGTGGLCVALSVRPRQPPGLYSAIVFDRADGSVQGTLSLSIEPSGAAP